MIARVAVAQHDDVKARFGPQAGNFTGRVELGAEPHRLHGGPAREVAAGDAVGKPRVVLDSRARPGLAADRHGVQRDGSQALRRAVHGGGEPGGPGPDDDQVEHVSGSWMKGQPEVLGERRRRGATQGLRGHDHRRDVLHAKPHAREQLVGLLDVLDVDPRVREMRVLRERAQAHRLRRVAGPDDADRLGSVLGAQDLAARDERVEDDFGQRRLGAEQPAKLGLRDHEHPARFRHATAQRAPLAGQEVELAREAARAIGGDHGGLGIIEAGDFGAALEQHEQVVGRLARLEQQLPGGRRLLGAEFCDLRELCGAQHGKRDSVPVSTGTAASRAGSLRPGRRRRHDYCQYRSTVSGGRAPA